MANDPSFPFYASDWLGSNKRAVMSLEQQAAYLLLLCRQWSDPTCSLPDDDAILANLSELREGWLKGSCQIVRPCFPKHPHLEGRIANTKLLHIRAERDAWKQKCSEGGKKSGETRRHKSRAAKGVTADDPQKSVEPSAKGSCDLVAKKGNYSPTNTPSKAELTPQVNTNSPSPSPSPSPSSFSSSSPSPLPLVESSRVDHLNSSSLKEKEIESQVYEFAKRHFPNSVFPNKTDRDREFFLKLAALWRCGKIPETCIVYGLEAIKHRQAGSPTNPAAYYTEVIMDWLEKNGYPVLGKLLVGVEVPVGLKGPKGARDE